MKTIYQLLLYIIRRTYEFWYVLLFRFLYVMRGKKIISDVEKYHEYIVDTKRLINKKRKEGISGFYRVKNEEYLLKASVESHIKYLDEIIIVYNDCSDRTPEIAMELQKKYPNKIKVYEYVPSVYPVLSKKHMLESGKSPHSIVNYYNFTLSKTTKKIVVKIDADHIAVDNLFGKVVQDIRKYGMNGGYYFFHGVNIFECGDDICINRKNPFTYGLDCGFFEVNKGMYFRHRRKYESLKIPLKVYFKRKNLGILFYHLKGFKKDKGVAFLHNTVKDSKKEAKRIIDAQFNPNLVKWDNFNDNRLNKVVHPKETLNYFLQE